jgi:hypothetical protein
LEVAHARLMQVQPLMVTPDYEPEWREARRLLQAMAGCLLLNTPDSIHELIADYSQVLEKIMGEGGAA